MCIFKRIQHLLSHNTIKSTGNIKAFHSNSMKFCFHFEMFVYFGQDISESADGQIALLVQLTAREQKKLLQ